MSKMRIVKRIICTVVATSVLIAALQASAAETLSDILHKSKWDGFTGTWVDAETRGTHFKMTVAWKLKNWVIEITTKDSDKETVNLMGVDQNTGGIFHMGADSNGFSSLGKWTVDNEGDAVQSILYGGPNGQKGAFSVRYHFEDKDTITITVELAQPIKFKVIRAKPEK